MHPDSMPEWVYPEPGDLVAYRIPERYRIGLGVGDEFWESSIQMYLGTGVVTNKGREMPVYYWWSFNDQRVIDVFSPPKPDRDIVIARYADAVG